MAGFRYHKEGMPLRKLPKGTKLSLQPEPGNLYDEYAVAVYRHDHKLGYIPRPFNRKVFDCLFNQVELNVTVRHLRKYAPDYKKLELSLTAPYTSVLNYANIGPPYRDVPDLNADNWGRYIKAHMDRFHERVLDSYRNKRLRSYIYTIDEEIIEGIVRSSYGYIESGLADLSWLPDNVRDYLKKTAKEQPQNWYKFEQKVETFLRHILRNFLFMHAEQLHNINMECKLLMFRSDITFPEGYLEKIKRTRFANVDVFGRPWMAGLRAAQVMHCYFHLPGFAEAFPYLHYEKGHHTIDHNCYSHGQLFGKTLRWDNPVWEKVLPPNHGTCNCRVIPVAEGEQGPVTTSEHPTLSNDPKRRHQYKTTLYDESIMASASVNFTDYLRVNELPQVSKWLMDAITRHTTIAMTF